MAERNTDRNPCFSSDSADSATPPPKATFSCKKPYDEQEEEDTDAVPESKRRKICPTSLDKIEELSPSSCNFSFTFDTKFTPCAPEITPKFGSFNFVASEPETDRLSQNSKDEGGVRDREPERRKEGEQAASGVREERNGVVVGELGKI